MKTFPFKNTPPLGAHTSIAGGVHNAVYHGAEIGCDVVQIFTKNQMQWNSKPLSGEDVSNFEKAIEVTGVLPMTVHDSYLINLGTANPKTYRRSYKTFVEEIVRSEQLGVPCLVMHPGSHLGEGEEPGMNRIAESIRKAYRESGAKNTVVLLEGTAGQGTNLGYSFEQLKYMMDRSGLDEKVGICLDTCHVFTAGYDIRTAAAWQKTRDKFNEIIGLEKLKAVHVNDSKKELGSRVDRHERIGKGLIGLEAFRSILNDPVMKEIPLIMEIPGGNKAYQEDLKILRSLVG